MHSSAYDQHVNQEQDYVSTHPVLRGFQKHLPIQHRLDIGTMLSVLEEYRPGEVPAFKRKHDEKWLDYAKNFPKAVFHEVTREL
jgi:hypothetical protein